MFYSYYRFENYQNKYSVEEISTTIKVLSHDKTTEYYSTYICTNENTDKFLVYFPKEIEVEIGQLFYAKTIFEKPSGMRNRGGFDYAKYLYSQDIYGILKVESDKDIFLKELPKFNIANEIRGSIINFFKKVLPKNEVGIMLGMIIGNTSYINENIKNDFKISGITHLLAVSGSNITYIILFTKFLFNKLVGKKVSNYIVIIFLIIFMLVVGCSPSVVRATIMGVIIIIAEILSKKSNVYASLSITALIMLLYNPLTIYDIGFVLSFGGTLGIVLFYERIKNAIINRYSIENRFVIPVIETFAVTISAQIVLTPIMCYTFNTFSLFLIIVNILIVPISGVLTIMGFVTYLIGIIYFPIGKLVSYSIFIIIRAIIIIAHLFSKIPFSSLIVITPKIYWVILYYLIIYMIVFKNDNKIFRCILCVIIALCIIIEQFPNKCLEINFIDVGQGDCTYIETRNKKVILIDGGGSESSDYDVGENILLPYILDRQKMKIDLIIVSHMHEDHLEGLLTIIEKIDVGKIIIGQSNNTELYKKLINISANKGIKIETVYTGETICIDDVKIEVIYPQKNHQIDKNENNNSLILKLMYENVSVLFTGDIEKEGEEKINGNINADILKVAHHGSKTSSTEKFINGVKPQISVIGVGEGNKFNHPSFEVIERLKKNNSIIYRTDENGEITIKIKNEKIYINNLIK
ncbi:MAG: DNA internalization-related competence protein ComEC/Rec2 [Clostridia bacterium]|nr:DNA internalization-related competence protein ComEC/Rec2 [Clostridia bacterium]